MRWHAQCYAGNARLALRWGLRAPAVAGAAGIVQEDKDGPD